jgi:hypothetical protein
MKKTKSSVRRKASRKRVAKRRFLSKKVIALAVVLIVAVVGGSQLLMSHAGTKPSFTAADYKCPVAAASNIPTQVLQLDSVGGCVDYYKTLLSQYQKGSGMGGVQLYESQSEIGDFDKKAVELTKSFQQHQKLSVTGEVDQLTWKALIDACYTQLRCEQ